MAAYDYIAIDGTGRRRRGTLQADSPQAAALSLQGRDLSPLRIAPGRNGRAASTAAGSPLFSGWPVRNRDRVMLLRQWSLMLRSGMTLLSTLDATLANAEKRRIRAAVTDIRRRVQDGSPFSEALAAHPKLLPPFIVSLIGSAEATGVMDEVMMRAADHLERSAEIRRNLITSVTYPAVVVAVSVGVVIFLVVGVIPKLSKFFVARQVELPASTRFLLDLSAFVTAYGLWILLGLLAGAFALAWTYTRPRGRVALDRLLLSMPIVGKLLLDASMALMTRTLAMLLESGLTLIRGIRITSRVVRNRAIAEQLAQAEKDVLSGSALSSGITDTAMPRLVHQLIDVGERTGDLSSVLYELADHYDNQLAYRLKQMVGMVEPALIIVIGGIVGFVYYAFFSALIGLTAGR